MAGASVILVDEEKKEFFFRVATYDNAETGENLKEIRFPLDKGVAGHVYRTGQPMIVPDTSRTPLFFRQVDEQSGHQTRNVLDVPIRTQDRTIGVLCAVDKKKGAFDETDVELMSAIASTAALPIENARINEALRRSYEDVRSLNRAKERVIHHLSHELKTPVSVLDASLRLLKKKLADLGETDRSNKASLHRILDRAWRNLDRILQMQYQIEDILKQRDYRTHQMLSTLLDVCMDEMEVLVEEELETRKSELETRHLTSGLGTLEPEDRVLKPESQVLELGIELETRHLTSGLGTLEPEDRVSKPESQVLELGIENVTADVLQTIRKRIDAIFGHREAVSEDIRMDRLVEGKIQEIGPHFAHRQCCLTFSNLDFQTPKSVRMPPKILSKMVEGLIRNAVENTPDRGRIEVTLRDGDEGPEFEVRDFGVGITEQNQGILFESNFSTRETMQYSSRSPYDFLAGGKGFDLLRMKIFSERYHFSIGMVSERCRFIPRDADICPGNIEACPHCRVPEDCFDTGGTTMTVHFLRSRARNCGTEG